MEKQTTQFVIKIPDGCYWMERARWSEKRMRSSDRSNQAHTLNHTFRDSWVDWLETSELLQEMYYQSKMPCARKVWGDRSTCKPSKFKRSMTLENKISWNKRVVPELRDLQALRQTAGHPQGGEFSAHQRTGIWGTTLRFSQWRWWQGWTGMKWVPWLAHHMV